MECLILVHFQHMPYYINLYYIRRSSIKLITTYIYYTYIETSALNEELSIQEIH